MGANRWSYVLVISVKQNTHVATSFRRNHYIHLAHTELSLVLYEFAEKELPFSDVNVSWTIKDERCSASTSCNE